MFGAQSDIEKEIKGGELFILLVQRKEKMLTCFHNHFRKGFY